MRRTGKVLILLIATLLLSMATLNTSLCSSSTTLSAPTIVDETKTPGSPAFWVNIYVAQVTNMWGYMFTLNYDTTVLTATDYASYVPFMLPEPCEINDTEGYVSIAYHMPFGVGAGFSTVAPAPIAKIQFTVDGLGWSWLDISDSIISDIYGEAISHDVLDGLFVNIATEYGANLVKKSAWPEHHHWDESKDLDQTLFGKVKNLGNVPTAAYVNFTLYNEDGLWKATFTTETVVIEPGEVIDLTATVTSADLIPITPYGKYYVRAQCWYDDGTGTFVPGAKLKSFSFALVP